MWGDATHKRSGWNLGGVNTKGRHNIEEDSWGCKKWQKSVILTDWMETLNQDVEGSHERSALEKSERGHSLTWSSHFNPKSYTAPAGTSRNSALISSPIGLANKLVQFKKRPLYSCSLKAAYTKTYEKNLWYSKTRKTSPWRFKSILLYIHKRGCKIKMTEGKTFRSHVSWPQFFK